VNDIEHRVLEILGEDLADPDVFVEGSDAFAHLRASVNDAIQDLCALTGTYTQTYHLTMLDGRQFYRVFSQADYFGYPLEVWDRTSKHKLDQSALSTIFQESGFAMDAAGPPRVYGQLGKDVLWFWPFDSNENRVIEIRAVMIPKAYTEDWERLKVRGNYVRAAAHFAASEIFASRGDAGRATEQWLKYLEVAGLMSLQKQQAERFFAQPRTSTRWRAEN
jgi:hypothetical protein